MKTFIACVACVAFAVAWIGAGTLIFVSFAGKEGRNGGAASASYSPQGGGRPVRADLGVSR